LGNIAETRKQDLHGLVSRVRYDLVNWHLRRDAVAWIREELGLKYSVRDAGVRDQDVEKPGRTPDAQEEDSDVEMSDEDSGVGKFNVESLDCPQVDARQIRIIWSDDRLGRLKISDDGRIEKAVVFGDGNRRLAGVERILCGDEGQRVTLKDLVERLELVYNKSATAETDVNDR
jgi:central kinetochore subunit Mal2/MCM21